MIIFVLKLESLTINLPAIQLLLNCYLLLPPEQSNQGHGIARPDNELPKPGVPGGTSSPIYLKLII